MKRILPFFIAFLPTLLIAQITIDKNDMPNLNDTFRISTTATIGGNNPANTDTNYFWDYSQLTAVAQRLDPYSSVSSTPFAYQLYFNNGILYPKNKASYAVPGQDISLGTISMKKVYNFYKNSSSAYEAVGFGAEIQGLPASVRDVPVDRLYAFPLNYMNTDSNMANFGISIPSLGYYGQNIIRIDTVDGWGTVKTPFGTFNAVRVKSTVYRTDTTYIDQTKTGFTIPRPAETEYKWLAKGMGIPVLTIIDRGVSMQVEYQDSVRNVPQVAVEENVDPVQSLDVYPNPVKSDFVVDIQLNGRSDVKMAIYDLLGNIVYTENKGQYHRGNVKWVVSTNDIGLSSNMYFLKVTVNNRVFTKKLMIGG